ncbi:hypothetical protein C8T65DRAFT_696295 [Cerioporus squamosus]|nr:hypothetical protein C8T65DRAFT_696295 [Cerioporus squamosus]
MSQAVPILLTLDSWVQQHITSLYSAKTSDDFNSAFDAFISQNVTIKVNGKPMSRDQYKALIMGEIKNDDGATVAFNGTVTVLDNAETFRPTQAGSAGVFFKATVLGRIFTLGQRQTSTVTSSLNVVVTTDPSVKEFDNRRVSFLDEVLTDVENPITFPPPPAQSGTNS